MHFKYWLVHAPDLKSLSSIGPLKRHPSREIANAEAKRLAQQQPGQQIVVLEAVTSFAVDKPQAREIGLPDMPENQNLASPAPKPAPPWARPPSALDEG